MLDLATVTTVMAIDAHLTEAQRRDEAIDDDDDDDYVTFLHITTSANADDILRYGIKPKIGASSKNDSRFFAVTDERGPIPRPTKGQISDMLSDMATQLDKRYRDEPLSVVEVRVPLRMVESLETAGFIHYGPYFPPGPSLGWTETIFETSSFAAVNSFRGTWNIQSLPNVR